MFVSLLLLVLLSCAGGHGRHLVKRSDDVSQLQVVVDRLTQDLTKLQAEFQALKTSVVKKAAFRAVLTTDHVTPNAPILFHLQSMTGGGYDQNTGIYTAPFSGWYNFHFHLYSHDAAALDMDLYSNGGLVSRALCHDSVRGFSCVSSATLHLQTGDKVWLQSDYGGPFYTAVFDDVFSGALVVPDD